MSAGAGKAKLAKLPKADMVKINRLEFESVCDQLKELTHAIVDAWACQGEYADGLETALVKLHAARRNLESCAKPAGAS